MPESEIGRRIRNISSRDELHVVLNALASEPGNRWTKTQVLFYLRRELHAAAETYFDAETLVGARIGPLDVNETALISINEALTKVEQLPKQPLSKRDELVDGSLANRDLNADPPRNDADLVGHVLVALRQEIRAIERQKTRRFRLSEGKCVAAEGPRYRYVFRWSSEPDLFVPGQLQLGKSEYPARVGGQGQEEKHFELLVDRFVGRIVPSAVFSVDPSFLTRLTFNLLSAARDRIESGLPLVEELFRKPDRTEGRILRDDGSGVLNTRQLAAKQIMRGAARSYIWGPPGTGKTTTLGAAIRECTQDDHRILVVSPYNVAVDEAILAARRAGTWSDGSIVRVGRVSSEVRDARLDLESHLERIAAQNGVLVAAQQFHRAIFYASGETTRGTPRTVRACLEEVGTAVIQADGEALAPLRKRLQEAVQILRELFHAPSDDIIQGARVVGTTIALSNMAPAIREGLFDRIVVDESSVVRIPDALLLAAREPQHISFFGDPRQLPSIINVQTPETKRWLKPNPFTIAGIRRPSDAGGACVFLAEQHRMAPRIRNLVSTLFYDQQLIDGHNPKDGLVLWCDTSATEARATTAMNGMSFSRENVIHRGVVAQILRGLAQAQPKASKLVLTPFRAQKAAYIKEANTHRIRGVKYGTIHANQGTESDIVIVDFVVAPGRGRPRFLVETRNEDLPNLLNVGISRAKTALVIVGHADHIREHYKGFLLYQLMQLVESTGLWVTVPQDMRMPLALLAPSVTPTG